MRYLDLHTHSLLSCGVDTPLRMQYHAKRLGIEIGLCDGIEAGDGVVIEAGSSKELIKALEKWRGRAGYIMVEGKNEKVAKAAFTKRGVDIVTLPSIESGWSFDAVAARKAKEMNVAVELRLDRLIQSYRMHRTRVIAGIRSCLRLKRKYGFDVVVTTGACCRYGLRKGDQVFELLRLLDFSEEEARSAMFEVPSTVLESRKSQILEGVKIKS